MNNEEFKEELLKLGIVLTKDQENQLQKYYEMIIEYNKHTNLTRITEKDEVYLKHFYDSATIIKVIELNNQSVLDVGTGAGFPGIVLKILFPNLKITLLDSLNKRIVFLNGVIKELELNDIKAVHYRAEEYAINHKEEFDIVTSRAVASLPVLLELCSQMIKVNGYFIAMKAEVEEELKSSSNAFNKLNLINEIKEDFSLPKEAGKRSLLKIKKRASTADAYPRNFNEIKKKPL